MRLHTIEVMAQDLTHSVFVYIPKQKRFFFVDDFDVEEEFTTLYFEEDINEKGKIIESEIKFKNTEMLRVVSQYNINKEEFTKEIEENIDLRMKEELELLLEKNWITWQNHFFVYISLCYFLADFIINKITK